MVQPETRSDTLITLLLHYLQPGNQINEQL